MTPKEPDTRPKTLWSETQLEMLYTAFEKHRPDAEILDIVRDLASRGHPPRYVLEKVRRQCGLHAATRLQSILAGVKRP